MRRPHRKIVCPAGLLHLALPLGLLLLTVVLLIQPATRRTTMFALSENHPVEWGTFFTLFAAAGVSIVLAWRVRKRCALFVPIFFGLFGVGLFVVAMEEIAWGQWVFGWDTPESWEAVNAQGETTLHNLGALQGHSELFRIAFGVGGLIGVAAMVWRPLRAIAVPPVLAGWFVVITVHGGLDLLNDFATLHVRFDALVDETAELNEFFIGLAAMLYVVMAAQRHARWRTAGDEISGRLGRGEVAGRAA